MSVIWTNKGLFEKVGFKSESDLEDAILRVQSELFGPNRVYLPVKKRIGPKKGNRNIPDGYLIDLNGSKPRLYVVENELASHELLNHIAVQILKFSLSFEDNRLNIKKIIFDSLQDLSVAKGRCEEFAKTNGYRNLDHFSEVLVFESPFTVLIIIDEIVENLETKLAEKFQFGIEVLELSRYENEHRERIYRFTPFLADIVVDVKTLTKAKKATFKPLDTKDLDTVVVPAHEDGFQRVFLGENRWYSVRIHGSMRPQLKYIAVYRVAPVSAITHVASIKSIEPWANSDKFVINFSELARTIGPIVLLKKSRIKALQNLRYTSKKRLDSAKTLDDIW